MRSLCILYPILYTYDYCIKEDYSKINNNISIVKKIIFMMSVLNVIYLYYSCNTFCCFNVIIKIY